MTISKSCIDCKPCKSHKDLEKCKPKCSKLKNILLECGDGAGSRTFTSSEDTPFQIAHVTIDTSCLNKPKILIKFSSLVRVDRLSSNPGIARLKYELFRACDGEKSKPIGIWIFEKDDISNSNFINAAEESFNFIFCECSSVSKCCNYFVKVTSLEISEVTVTVSNGRIAALTQSSKDCSSNERKGFELINKSRNSKDKPKRLKDAILACGSGNGSAVFRMGNLEPVRIANVEIDTSLLCKPKVLIEFSSIISYNHITSAVSPDATVHFQFELFRQCDNGKPLSRGMWTYEVGLIEGTNQVAQGFGFTFCECLDFSSCCEYFVTLTPIEVPTRDRENAMISNSRMTALAQSSKTHDNSCNILDCKDEKTVTKKILLECGNGTGSKTFTSSNDTAFQLAQVTVDTKELCSPIVNIEFSSIVSFEQINNDPDIFLRYELFRVCGDGSVESRGVWTLISAEQDTAKVTQSFDFTFCESIICKKGCCTYFVKVTPLEVLNGQVSVSNGRIAALVQERY